MKKIQFAGLWLALTMLLCTGVTAAQSEFIGITANNVNVRVSPGTEAALITALPVNTTVIVEGRNGAGDWLLIHTQDNAVRGWAARRFIDLINVNIAMLPVTNETLSGGAAPPPPAPATVPEAPAAPEQPGVATNPGGASGTISADNVNVRATPSTRGNRIGGVTGGTVVTLQGRNAAGDWVLISVGSLQGWVAARFVRPADGVQIAALPVVNTTITTASGVAPTSVPPAPPPATASTNFIVMPSWVINNARVIFERGKSFGNNPASFIKIGDSNMVGNEYLCPFNSSNYNLGSYGHLQGIIDIFRSTSSFCNNDPSVHEGFTTSSILDAYFIINPECQTDEIPLACAVRLRHPAFAFIYVGVLDMNYLPAEEFEENLRKMTDFLVARGVIPIHSTFTIDDWRHDGRARFYNEAIRRVATRYSVPLIDLQAALYSYPARGTREDGFHLSVRDPNVITFTGDENVYGRTKRELLSMEVLHTLYWQVAR